MKLVLVEWIDAHQQSGWHSLEDIEDSCQPVYCRSVGWMMKKNKHITIIPHLSGEKNGDIVVHGRGYLTIPEKAITKMTVLRNK